jgi:hypothetical protein
MAIKSKGRTKPRQAARAPRREPVDVRGPLLSRRWVQLVAAFLVGLGVFWFAIWLTNGLRDQQATKDLEAQIAKQRQAMQSWKAELETQIGGLAPIQDPVPPAVGTDVSAAARAISKGQDPKVAAAALSAKAEDLTKAADALETYALADTIRDHGFNADRVNTITVSRTEIVQSLRLFANAAILTARAIDAPDELAKPIAERALEVTDSANALLNDAWRAYQLVLADAGLASAPNLPTPLG